MMQTYNGWSGLIRTVRGREFYSLLKENKIAPLINCGLCGGDGGLTYHAEEYGSTWDDYVSSTHPVCAYCHGLIHLRFEFPNRWRRHLAQIGQGVKLPSKFNSLHQFFSTAKSFVDCAPVELTPSGVLWADSLPTALISFEWMKVALVKTDMGMFKPDPKIYSEPLKSFRGLRYDHATAQIYEYSYVEEVNDRNVT
jgi:hypothetical protein